MAAIMPLLFALGCGESPEDRTRIADVEAPVTAAGDTVSTSRRASVYAPLAGSLARAAGGPDGRTYTVQTIANPGVIIGEITGGAPTDTSITPTHDLRVCRPFSQSLVPSRDGGVGNAVVWLSGVASGPKDDAPRRARLTLDGCRLEPRVQRVALASTVLVNGRDAMLSRLQFTVDGEAAPRTTVLLSDVGQIVPSDASSTTPGLVRVSDDLHPWVRAYIVVAPHPFVAVTTADGQFRFDGVAPGRYTLHVWHERLGTQEKKVRVDGGVQTKISVEY
jgi:hypothetical protein